MKFVFSICAAVLFAFTIAQGQVSSHQQTQFTAPSPQPSQPQPKSQFEVSSTQLKAMGRPVARVNGVVLTDADLVREEYVIFPYAKQHDGKLPASFEPGIRKGAMEMIIFEELVYQDAQKRGMKMSPQRIDQAEAELRGQFAAPSDFLQYLQAEFQGSETALRKKIERSLLIDQLLKTEVDAKSHVSAAELRAYYDKNAARFQYPESFAIQTITIMPPDKATPKQLEEAKKRADDAYKQAKATKNAEQFGILAEKVSDDDYRVMMGDHKWIKRQDIPPEMLAPALKMKDGEMSGLIQVGQYYVIFRMNKHVQAGKTPFELVKDRLRKELEKEKTEQVRAALDKKLRENAKVETL